MKRFSCRSCWPIEVEGPYCTSFLACGGFGYIPAQVIVGAGRNLHKPVFLYRLLPLQLSRRFHVFAKALELRGSMLRFLVVLQSRYRNSLGRCAGAAL